MEDVMEDIVLFAMECNDCGWDWIGRFAVCINCGSSNSNLVEEISDEKMFDRLYWINLKTIKGFTNPSADINRIDRLFNQGWETG